jgi:hypothetical protein
MKRINVGLFELQAFARLAELRSFRAAAEELGLSGPALILLCHKSAVTGVDEPLLAYRRWQHGQRGRRRARATVRRRRTEAIENGSCRSGRSGMPARPPTGG